MVDPQIWPPELDALIAAPDHHRLKLENDSVRVLETKIMPGETTPIHTHCWPATYYVISWSDFIRRDDKGEILVDSLTKGITMEPGETIWTGEMGPHSLENVGDKPIHIISVEVKNPS